MLNVFCIAGKIAKEPEVRETPGGIKMTSLHIDVERPFANAQGVYENDTVEVEVWRGMAEVVQSCSKGTWVTVKGRIASRPTVKDGRTYSNYAFVAERVDILR
ncbi:single-stranded DNA-binding protein [Faecalibaculum rodentium]|uniref:single-stranded DNA-binding protein n=1 Tax=Faecalibaculum rodentium TaxID=1702221 RepID=UPI0025A647F3|nr:single-stranded DNA-binding protein [Faecalibaculum rodentium]